MRQINYSSEKIEDPEEKKLLIKPKRKRWLIIKIILVIGIFGLGLISFKIFSSSEDDSLTFWTELKHLITSKDKELIGEEKEVDRINVLLLGVGGEGHNGPYLTDTILLASLKPSTKKLAMISIPRDLFVPIPDVGWRKINYAYALGEAVEPGSGGNLAKEVVSNVLGVPIHYYVRIDFDGFIKIIDDLDGVTLEVKNTIDDEFFPVPGKETATTSERYEHFYLEKGVTYMDGKTALRYVRSRKAKGIEGSDFARSQRQQNLLIALKEKIISANTLLNPNKLNKIIKTLNAHLDTNMEAWEMLRIYSLGKNIKTTDIIMKTLSDDQYTGELYADMVSEAFVLKTKSGDFLELQNLTKNIFETQAPEVAVEEKNEAEEKNIEEILSDNKTNYKIEIHNGTNIAGLAKKTSQYLKNQGYNITEIGNAPIQTYKKTLIYSLDKKTNSKILTDLEKKLNAIVFVSGPPADLTNSEGKSIPYPIKPETNILIILGEDVDIKL